MLGVDRRLLKFVQFASRSDWPCDQCELKLVVWTPPMDPFAQGVCRPLKKSVVLVKDQRVARS